MSVQLRDNEAATAFGRATHARLRAEHHARALGGTVRTMVRQPAPKDGAVLAMFLDVAILAIIAAARWHQLGHHDQHVTATNGHRQTWQLDAASRFRSWKTETGSGSTWTQTGSKLNHYDGDGDNPR